MSIIEMRDVVKKYDNGTTALRGVSVTVQPGEFAYIVGPSGAGKSTFIRSLYREVKLRKRMFHCYVVVSGWYFRIINFYLRKLSMKTLPMLWK